MKIEKYHDFATCDEHLTRFLRGTTGTFYRGVEDGGDGSVTLVMRVTELIVPLESYKCDCGKFATWYFTNRGTSIRRWLDEQSGAGPSVTVTARTPEGEEIGKWVTDEKGRHTPLS